MWLLCKIRCKRSLRNLTSHPAVLYSCCLIQRTFTLQLLVNLESVSTLKVCRKKEKKKKVCLTFSRKFHRCHHQSDWWGDKTFSSDNNPDGHHHHQFNCSHDFYNKCCECVWSVRSFSDRNALIALTITNCMFHSSADLYFQVKLNVSIKGSHDTDQSIFTWVCLTEKQSSY